MHHIFIMVNVLMFNTVPWWKGIKQFLKQAQAARFINTEDWETNLYNSIYSNCCWSRSYYAIFISNSFPSWHGRCRWWNFHFFWQPLIPVWLQSFSVSKQAHFDATFSLQRSFSSCYVCLNNLKHLQCQFVLLVKLHLKLLFPRWRIQLMSL